MDLKILGYLLCVSLEEIIRNILFLDFKDVNFL